MSTAETALSTAEPPLSTAEPAPSTADAVAGRYELRAVLGRGATGVVYRGRDRVLQRDVAIKILHLEVAGEDATSVRFQKGTRLAARINHPNAVAIFDTGTHEGQPFVVMEYLSGETLAALIAAQPLPCSQVRTIATQLLGALAAAHRRGVIHRDIKPANLLFTSAGALKVVDFGIATGAEGNMVTGPGLVVGTLAYLAPERLQGAPATPQSDIYSAGVVLYEALTGQKPFSADTPATLLDEMSNSSPRDLAPLRPDVDPRLTRVVMRALQTDPKARYATAAAMANALERSRRSNVKKRSSLPAPPPTPTIGASPIEEGSRRHRLRGLRVFMASAVALAAASCVGAFAFYGGGSSHPSQRTSLVATESPSPGVDVVPVVSTTVATTTAPTTTSSSSTTVQTTTRPTSTTAPTTTTSPSTTTGGRTRSKGKRTND
ncbi:MAG: serine/threonine protein kinase [Actinobacteria bacterium]|nr:MAG: serine/threonine protein kinase [Actinomycetota bacterium]